MKCSKVFFSVIVFSCSFFCIGDDTQIWPQGETIAISLSYDDALDSQLDTALPALNQRGLKASFYVVPTSDAFTNRLDEWRMLAAQGHELGNHTLHHACSRSKPDRDWVSPMNALDSKTVHDMVKEVKVANTLLMALDGQKQRTFTPPCFDQLANDGNYVDAVKDLFLGVKSTDAASFAALIAPSEINAEDIIRFIEQQPANVKLINVLFHGVGGDYLSVTKAEHAKLLDYLVANKGRYWVDTYRNIMLRKAEQLTK
ncbi:polysaccharide deacetylase family protein [Glaciecola siphonariae]|uniref:Polysaccharide deacetylase family protein n=1 Tax=Glaciecola siphonariae TaxID=521012 RepID=A0ABV9LSS4_9ALTE